MEMGRNGSQTEVRILQEMRPRMLGCPEALDGAPEDSHHDRTSAVEPRVLRGPFRAGGAPEPQTQRPGSSFLVPLYAANPSIP